MFGPLTCLVGLNAQAVLDIERHLLELQQALIEEDDPSSVALVSIGFVRGRFEELAGHARTAIAMEQRRADDALVNEMPIRPLDRQAIENMGRESLERLRERSRNAFGGIGGTPPEPPFEFSAHGHAATERGNASAEPAEE